VWANARPRRSTAALGHRISARRGIGQSSAGVAPPVPDFPDVTRSYVEARAAQTGLAELRARYLDFLWLRWRDHHDGRGARAAYVDAVAELETARPFGAVEASERLQRAAALSLQLHDAESETAATVREFAMRTLGGRPGAPCFLVEAAATLLVRVDAIETRALAEAFEARAEAAGGAANRWEERAFTEAAEVLARELGDHSWVRRLKLESARSLEFEAAERAGEGGLVQSTLIRESIAAYAAGGAGEDVQRLKVDYAAASARIGDDLKAVAVQFEVTPEQVDLLLQVSAAQSNDPAALLALPDEWGLWPTRAELEAQGEQLREAAPFLSMVQHTSIEADGRVRAEPADSDEAADARLISQCAQRAQFAVGLLVVPLEKLRADARCSAERIAAALALADGDLASSVRPGAAAYERGDWWLALHALAPQIERGVRIVARRTDAQVTRLTASHGWRWASLTEMLAEPAVRDALGDELAFGLTAIFDSPYGPNVRNNVAHGAFSTEADGQIPATLALFGLLTIASRLTGMRAQGIESPRATIH
jgi:hypothetical protein